MQKLRLKTSAVIQGDFEINSLNVLLTFQVNCPGCFIHGLPLANEIHKKYGDELNVLGLATAFEDFGHNTEENAELLIKDGTLVGETKRVVKENGYDKLPYTIDFPVATDLRMNNDREIYSPEDARGVCELSPKFTAINEDDQEEAVSKIMQNLNSIGQSSYTFTVNLMRGTPTWVIFDKDMNILEHWFGHRDKEVVFKILDKRLISVKNSARTKRQFVQPGRYVSQRRIVLVFK